LGDGELGELAKFTLARKLKARKKEDEGKAPTARLSCKTMLAMYCKPLTVRHVTTRVGDALHEHGDVCVDAQATHVDPFRAV